jgi:glycosyltransferase involved in cell wall biosynthesis
MVSALIETKRVTDAIRAVGRMEDAFLVVAGDGPLRSETDRLAQEFLPDRFKRLTLTPEQMPSLYRSADVFLHLSETESFGNVYLEARASGLPIVAHDSPSLRWIIGEGQYLCDTKNQAVLVDRLGAALRNGSEAEPSDLARFEWRRVADQYRSFIESTLRGAGCSRRSRVVSGGAR